MKFIWGGQLAAVEGLATYEYGGPKPPNTFGEGHVCSKPAGHDNYDGLHHTCANCGADFNSLSVAPCSYRRMEDEERAKFIRQRLETPTFEGKEDGYL